MPIPNNSRVSVDELRDRLWYDPFTGAIRWRTHRKSTSVGCEAGTIALNGYRYISVNNKKMLAQRVAWALYYGDYPEVGVDHINRNRQDNRIANLRLAEGGQNHANSRVRSHNVSGVKGVSLRKGRYAAFICKDRVQRYLGTYSTAEEAHEAYMAAARELHGEFAHDGSL